MQTLRVTLIATMVLSCIFSPACTTRQSTPQTATTNAAHLVNDAGFDKMPELASPSYESEDEQCTPALYWADEPISSQLSLTSAAELEQACNNAQIACYRRCMNNPNPKWPAQKKGDFYHRKYCNEKCLAEFMACMRKAGLLQEFSALDKAWAWIKQHGKAIVGTIVIIGGVAYIVSTAGSGALVLVLL